MSVFNYRKTSAKYRPSSALLEHMLEGHKVSTLEATLLFGVQTPTAEMTNIRRKGFLVKKELVPMAKVLRRLNEVCNCIPPSQLPVREILMSEYWISK